MPRLRWSSPATPCREGQVPVLGFLFLKQRDQINSGNKGSSLFTLPHFSPSLKETSRSSRQVGNLETGAGTGRQGSTAYWLAPRDQLSVLSYTVLHHLPRAQLHHQQWSSPAHINHCSRKCSADLPMGQSSGGVISVERELVSQLTIACAKVTQN